MEAAQHPITGLNEATVGQRGQKDKCSVVSTNANMQLFFLNTTQVQDKMEYCPESNYSNTQEKKNKYTVSADIWCQHVVICFPFFICSWKQKPD